MNNINNLTLQNFLSGIEKANAGIENLSKSVKVFQDLLDDGKDSAKSATQRLNEKIARVDLDAPNTPTILHGTKNEPAEKIRLDFSGEFGDEKWLIASLLQLHIVISSAMTALKMFDYSKGSYDSEKVLEVNDPHDILNSEPMLGFVRDILNFFSGPFLISIEYAIRKGLQQQEERTRVSHFDKNNNTITIDHNPEPENGYTWPHQINDNNTKDTRSFDELVAAKLGAIIVPEGVSFENVVLGELRKNLKIDVDETKLTGTQLRELLISILKLKPDKKLDYETDDNSSNFDKKYNIGSGAGEQNKNYAQTAYRSVVKGRDAQIGAEHSLERAGGAKRNTGPGPLEVFEGVTGEAQKIGGALTTIMQTLNIGADTFVGGLINGFNSALTIIQSMIAVMQAVNTIKMFLPFATGGSVPGIGDTDSVPAVLTPGEYVIKKSVVNKFGTGFFEWINGGGLTNSLAGHYAGGGLVAAGSAQTVAVSIPDVKIKGSDLYLSWRRENNIHGRRSI